MHRPQTSQIVFGIGIDTDRWRYYVPDEKAEKALALLHSMHTRDLSLLCKRRSADHWSSGLPCAGIGCVTYISETVD